MCWIQIIGFQHIFDNGFFKSSQMADTNFFLRCFQNMICEINQYRLVYINFRTDCFFEQFVSWIEINFCFQHLAFFIMAYFSEKSKNFMQTVKPVFDIISSVQPHIHFRP